MINYQDRYLKDEPIFAKSFLGLLSELTIDGSEDVLSFASMKNTLLLMHNSAV